MLKLMLTVLFLKVGLPCFSDEFRHDLKEWQMESLKHFCYGSANLFSHEPCKALEDFQRATTCLDRSDRSSSSIDFLILFGQAIAYDVLGFREQYKQTIGSLFELSWLFSLGVNLKVFRTDDTEQKFKYLFMGNKIKSTDHDNMWEGELGIPLVWNISCTNRWEVQLEPYFLKFDFSEVQNIYGTRLLFGCSF